ncbi:MAG: hypothetical protein ABL862_09575 [Candidatus Nitrotoga sp.]
MDTSFLSSEDACLWEHLAKLYASENHLSITASEIKARIQTACLLSKHKINIPAAIMRDSKIVAFWVLHIDSQNHLNGVGPCGFSNLISIANERDLLALVNGSLALINQISPENVNAGLTGPIHTSVLVSRGLRLFEDDFIPFSMPNNKKALSDVLMSLGFVKDKDMIEIVYEHCDDNTILVESNNKILKRLEEIEFIKITKENIESYLEDITDCYNISWSNNWGYSAASVTEFRLAAKNLSNFIGMIAVKNNCLLGFTMMALDEDAKGVYGRAFFTGVLPNYRRLGLSPILTTKLAHIGIIDLEVKRFSVSWMLEENLMVLRTMKKLLQGGSFFERSYRIFSYFPLNKLQLA